LSETERADLHALYAAVDAEIGAENPRCDVSGRCCRFNEYGHTLFLSAAEAELLFAVAPAAGGAECPYQIAGRCTARERRPLGCRIYFCDPNYAARMIEISESAVKRLKQLHGGWGRGWDYRPLERFLTDAEYFSATPSSEVCVLPILASPPGKLDSTSCGE